MEDNTNSKSLKECALEYVNNGFALVPIAEKQKTKYLLKWKEKQVKTADEVESWWNECPNYNIAIVAGKLSKNLLVIDVDMKNGENGMGALEKWAESHEKIKCNAIATTPNGGYHYYFYVPDEIASEFDKESINSPVNIYKGEYDGVDIRYNKAVIDAPPSYLDYVDKEGKRNEGYYKWLVGGYDTISFLDRNVADFIIEGVKRQRSKKNSSKASANKKAKEKGTAELLGMVVGIGERNDTIMKVMGKWQTEGKSDRYIRQEAYAFNATHFIDKDGNPAPLPKDELDKKIEYILSKPKGGIKISGYMRQLRDKLREIEPEHHSLDDTGYADIFRALFGDVLIYVEEAKTWFYYNGKYWKKDISKKRALGKAILLSKLLLSYAFDLDEGEEKEMLLKAYRRLGYVVNQKNIIESASARMIKSYSDLDKDPNLFNCQNGTLNLETMEFRKHDPKDMITKMSNVYYDRNARSELWENTVKETFRGDKGKIGFHQQVFGLCLTTDVSPECAFIYQGKPRTGKTTMLETLEYMLSPSENGYATTIDRTTLALGNRKQGGNPRPDKAKLNAKRYAYLSEPDKGMVLDSAELKTWVSGASLTARFLNENEFNFHPTFHLIIDTNHEIAVTDYTIFSGDKIWVLEFDNVRPREKRDTTLKDRLRSRENISGIFNWCIEGLNRYIFNGRRLDIPQVIRDSTKKYEVSTDKIQMFFSEVMTEKKGQQSDGHYVYEEYKKWCQANNMRALSAQNFYKDLRERGYFIDGGRLNGGRYVRNRIHDWVIANPLDGS